MFFLSLKLNAVSYLKRITNLKQKQQQKNVTRAIEMELEGK